MLATRVKKRDVLCIVLLVLALVLTTYTPSNSAQKPGEKISLKVAHVVNTDHPYHTGLLKFKEIVEAKTSGAITITIYPSGQLGNERDTLEALQLGTLDMCLAATAPLTGFEEKFMLFDLPFLFASKEHAYRVLDGKIGQQVLSLLESKKMKGLSYFEVGFRNFTNRVRPINVPNDMKGLKFRLMETPVHVKSVAVWGGMPTAMAIGEVFTSLQQGTIDGQENPLPIIDTFKFYEVQKYLSISEHFYTATPLLIQKKIWDKLPPEQRKIMLEAAMAGSGVCRQKNAEKDKVLIEKFKGKGMQVNFADKGEFLKASKPVYDYFGEKLGKDIIKEIIEMGKK